MARRELVVACTLIGALGGALFGYPLARTGGTFHSWRWSLVASLTVCTTVSATLLGWFLARRAEHAVAVGGRAAWASFVAGALNGALMAIATAMTEHTSGAANLFLLVCAAAVFGTICAIPFAPAIIVVAMTAAYADARVDSLAARSQGRRVLRNALASLAVAAAVIGKRPQDPLTAHLPIYIIAAALVVIAILGVLEFVAHRSLAAPGTWEPLPDGVQVAPTLDYGVGHEMSIRRAHDETYRTTTAALDARRGCPEKARAVLNASLRGHAIAGAAAAVALIVSNR